VLVDVRSAIEHAVDELEPGGRLVRSSQLTGGVSADVFGLDIATARGDSRRVVYRRHRSPDFKQQAGTVTAKEYGVLAALHREGVAVPEPYLLGDTETNGGAFMLIEWIDGSTDVRTADVTRALDEMARFLVDLHSLDVRSLQIPGLEPVEDPVASIVPYLPATGSGALVRAALAAGALAPDPNPAVLLHGDFWPGNILWRDGVLVGVIDWEDACLGDPVADLATARVELLCQYGQGAMDHFTARYVALARDADASLRLDPLVAWDLYVSAAALSSMGAWGLEPAEEARRRRLTEGFFDSRAACLTPVQGV
jgi:aminoglycoside phosphotransferase (APT) family kinase protein